MPDISLDNLPNELLGAIGRYLHVSGLAALARTSRRFHLIQDMLYDIAVTYKIGPNKECHVELTVLQWAVREPAQRRCTLDTILRKGADIYVEGLLPRSTILHDVAIQGDVEATTLIVKAGIHPWTSYHDCSPLAYASGGGHEAVVRYLLYDAVDMWEREALPRTTTCEKWSQLTKSLEGRQRLFALQDGLHRAAKRGHIKIVELLCQHVNVSEPPLSGVPFTSSAAEGVSVEIMEMLLGLGAKLYPVVLCTAASLGHLPLVQYIIFKCPTYVTCGGNTTPLHCAAKAGHADIVEVLLFHGANHIVEDECESTPLDLAIYFRHRDVISILKSQDYPEIPAWLFEKDDF